MSVDVLTSDVLTSTVGVIVTGGTVASTHRDRAGETVVSLAIDTDDALAWSLELVHASLPSGPEREFRAVSPLAVMSEDMVPRDWWSIATAVRRLAATGIRRVLVLHGTDTMGYTAAALSYMLADLDVTLVITGANLPSGHVASDAPKNVHDALLAADALPRGVYVVFAGHPDRPGLVHLGTQVRKVRASGHTFESINRAPVARVDGGIVTVIEPWSPPDAADVGLLLSRFDTRHSHSSATSIPDDRVLSFRVHPGIDLRTQKYSVRAGLCRALVIELYAAVTGPGRGARHSLPSFIAACRAAGATVFLTTPAAPDGHLDPYDSTVALREAGGVYLPGMIPEAAVVKAMWALGRCAGEADVATLMAIPIAGDLRSGRLG